MPRTINANTLINRFLRAMRKGEAPAAAWNDVIDWLDAWAIEMEEHAQDGKAMRELASWWCTIDPRALAAAQKAAA
jgi:hypothetical protein